MTACLDDDLVGALVSRQLGAEQAVAAREHLDTCASCRRLVASLAQSVAPEGEATMVDPAPPAVPGSEAPLTDLTELVGRTIGGKYRVLRVIGQGGMGCVVAADHLQLRTQVALKVLHPHRVFVEEARARLGREAVAAARVASPYAARVFDVGTTEEGLPFLVMELLEGHDLGEELKIRGKIEWREAVRWTLQACHALAEAHRRGIVHRDLKPQNVFVVAGSGKRSVKLVDFGISKFLGGDGGDESSYTGEAWVGTPRYMAPEQLKLGHRVDERTDVWAIGLILHELVSGRHPFERPSLKAHCAAVLGEEPASLDPTLVPVGLDAVIGRCVTKAPEGRFPSAREVAVALAPFADAASASVLEEMGIGVGRRGSLASIALPARPASPPARLVVGAAAAVVAVVAVVAMVTALGMRDRSRADAEAAAMAATVAASASPMLAPADSSGSGVSIASPPVTVSAADIVPDGADAAAAAPRLLRHVAPPRHARNAEFGGRR